jgi:outer membrane protein OmpA-like peptidoglycan-associated protein
MKYLITAIILSLSVSNCYAQLFKKLKEKAQEVLTKPTTGSSEKKQTNNNDATAATEENSENNQQEKPKLKVYSKFDFVPGSTILHFDNFEKDNIGEAPLGWITSTSAEVVTIDGLEGNWLKMGSTSSQHITRNKKQSWGNNFSVEFDLLLVKNTYDPRVDFQLINTGGKLVTDESILRDAKSSVYISTILGNMGKQSRVAIYGAPDYNRSISDRMSEALPFSNNVPVHVSICVQGKRFRFWWNENKIFDLPAVKEDYLPNQLGLSFGSVGGIEVYISNIRIAKDVPDTRAKFEEGKLISNLLFYTGTAKLKPESMGALLDVSKILKEATEPVKIIGHTDSDGEDAANIKLSEERAQTVKNILITQYNIAEDKLTTEGRGETQPLAGNNSAEGKAQNRRVEFIFKAEADKYIKPTGVPTTPKPAVKPAAKSSKSSASTNNKESPNTDGPTVKLQSKTLTINLPYAQFIKMGEGLYSFIASKEEGNSKENYFKIEIEGLNSSLKPETFNFAEFNKKKPLYGTKKFPEIKKTEAILYYGAGKLPFITEFSPIIANGALVNYVDNSLREKLPPASPNCKFVIESITDGKASDYFTAGLIIDGLKPILKGDGMQREYTTGFAGEMKCSFVNVPVL